LQRVGPLWRHDEVGLTELPPFGEHGRCRQRSGVAFGCPGVYPSCDEVDLIVAQPAFADVRAGAGVRQPRRHVPIADGINDLVGM
jgi:hypothetical protein